MAFGFLKKAIKVAGKGIKGTAKLASGAGKLVGRVPVVGGGLKGVFTLTVSGPFLVAGDVASGKRIDKVALNHLKRQVGAVKDVAPYAQTVVSLVPGVGQGISAGIGAGLALAEGQPISAAIIAGVKGALPGGALAQSAFDVSCAVVQGKPVDKIIVAGLPLSAQQKHALQTVVTTAKAIAQGQRVDVAIADNALKALPPDVQKAVNIGIAVAEGQRLQNVAVRHVAPAALGKLAKEGVAIAKSNPIVAAGARVIKDVREKQGFAVGAGVMNHKISPVQLVAIRTKLVGTQRKGFDLAVATHIGVATKKMPVNMTPEQKFGYAATQGLAGASPQMKGALLATVAKNPAAKTGATIAIEQDKIMRKAWWRRFLAGIGFSQFGGDPEFTFGEDYGSLS